MRKLHVSTLLVLINVGLLLLAVAGLAVVAIRLLQQLADEQALARVEQAGTIAREQVDSTGQSLRISAQLLSERPTLNRLLEERDLAALPPFLAQFQQTSRIDATAVILDGKVVATTGISVSWESLWRSRPGGGAPFLERSAADGGLILGAWAVIPSLPESAVAVALRLDEAVARRLSTEIGLPVTIVSWEKLEARDVEPQALLWQRALATRRVATARLDAFPAYLAVVPLLSPTSEVVGIIETQLPAAGVSTSLREFGDTLLFLAVLLATAAGAISLLFGRRLGRPLRALTGAAERIGRGDLLTPVRVRAGAEVGQLANTFEEMRGQLLRLTDDLRRQQAEAQAIVTGIIEGVFTVDRERRIRYLNAQAAAMLGTTSEAAIGRFCGDVLRPEGANGVRPCEDRCPIVHARFRGGARATEHLRLPDGRRRTVVITSAPSVEDMQVQVMRDETEIEASRRARDAILANISHEFRTPLSAQLASIELLLDQLPDLTIAQIGDLVRAQHRGTLRLTQLIDNLLESARIEAGQLVIGQQRVALDEVIEEALELTRPLLHQRRQEVTLDLPYPLPPVCGDTRRLTQVFVNLLGNANKFAPEGSTIDIGGTIASGSITLWVADQGPGLPAIAGQGIFKRFVRSAHGEPEQSGVGLGLWLVKSIVERHGGHIDARSDAHGTCMTVVLPVEGHEDPDRR